MKKKLLATLLCAALVGTLLSGCGNGSSNSAGDAARQEAPALDETSASDASADT